MVAQAIELVMPAEAALELAAHAMISFDDPVSVYGLSCRQPLPFEVLLAYRNPQLKLMAGVVLIIRPR